MMREFDALKEEQRARILYRDGLLRLCLVSVGAVWAYVAAYPGEIAVILTLPWITFVFGWTYLVNDEKVSSIGRYVRGSLAARIATEIGLPSHEEVFQWEIYHAADPLRVSRKYIQWIVDVGTFVASGMVACAYYWIEVEDRSAWRSGACIAGFLSLIVLAYFITGYADTRRRRMRRG